MMGAFGRFLELSVPAGDILKSLAFWRALGFAELTTGDIRRHHYAVVTDGAVAIGLHAGGIEEIALSFVRPNLAKQVRALEEAGREFEFVRLGAEEFHEAALRSPDGQLIVMMEARTFSPGGEHGEPARPLLGRCAEIALACRDPDASRAFWEAAGFIAEPGDDGPPRLVAPGVTLGLHESARRASPALRFAVPADQATLSALDARGIAVSREGQATVLRSPEGLRLVVA